MTDERFNQLLAGPLTGPMPMFTMMRLVQALRHVVSACGDSGERALEEYCTAREQLDNSQDSAELDDSQESPELDDSQL